MATQQATYKKYKRGQRQANVETEFVNGMMYTDGAVSDGYVKTLVNFDFTQDGRNALKPRAALAACELIVPDMSELDPEYFDEEAFLNTDTAIKYSKETVEDGRNLRQFIFGKPDVLDDELLDTGTIWLATSERNIDDFEDVITTAYDLCQEEAKCAFYGTSLSEIHSTALLPDAKTSFPVGAFLGNSFYYFTQAGDGYLNKTEYFDDRYVFHKELLNEDDEEESFGLKPKELTASEAVNYGYNMLSSAPYEFLDKNNAAMFQMDGILPYEDESSTKLMMTPRANSRVWFRCNYSAPSETYKIVWSWKEVSGTDDWTVFKTDDAFDPSLLPKLVADLVVPAKEIMIRCEAYNLDSEDPDIVERAMTVGFDFTLSGDSTTRNSQPEEYDLSTSTGMTSWKNRLVVWGLPKDPNIVFISDLEEPTYFPYPNNSIIYDEPVIAVTELMDNLVVFTKSKIHQVELDKDGVTWTSTVLQSNLYIESWDKHLIQTVRNMLYFKSGNYYYMIVPKAQSTTGELTIAPITTPITDFFNHFQSNVSYIFKECFKEGGGVYHNPTDIEEAWQDNGLITYYNFIDYEFIHNFYIYRYRDIYVHFDIIYNVVNRYWKINIYESPHFLYPFRNDATQNGLIAVTSPINVNNKEDEAIQTKRLVQLFKFDPLTPDDSYVPFDTLIEYDLSHEDASTDSIDQLLTIPSDAVEYDPDTETLIIDSDYIREREIPNELLFFINDNAYIGGFSSIGLRDTIYDTTESINERMYFPNKQFLDTGYRDANLFINKRYRELQLQINNPDNVDMEFGMDFQIAGEPRNTDFLYEVSQTIDELHQDEGIVYLDATPYLPIPYDDGEERKGEIDKTNAWTLEHSLNPDISLWKVRASVSGKGMAPRLRLFTKNRFNYQLLGINWIYREMNMR